MRPSKMRRCRRCLRNFTRPADFYRGRAGALQLCDGCGVVEVGCSCPRMPTFLAGNKSTALPARIVYVDTETETTELPNRTVEHSLRLGSALYVQRAGNKQTAKEEWLDFARPHDYWTWVERKGVAGRRLVVLAHNTGFDLQVLGGPQLLAARGWKITKPAVIGDVLILHLEREGCGLLVLDFANYMPVPLERIGERLGIEKLPLPADDAPHAEWLARCRRDVVILRSAFERWLELVRDADLGHFAETLPKQAMNGYRHRFMEARTIAVGDGRPAKLERAAYFGGRTEAHRLGQLKRETWHKLDANGFYAAVMRDELYPTRVRWLIHGLTLDSLPKLAAKRLIIARCRIKTDLPIYPVRLDGRLVFPVGGFDTTLATPELLEAHRRGHLVAIGPSAVYEQAPLFTAWVDALWSLRRAAVDRGDLLTADLAKRLQTGLYGRFGMRVAPWEHAGDEPGGPDELYRVWDADRGAHRTFRRLAGRLEVQGAREDSDKAMIAIPAHVASYGRVRLWRWMERAGLEHVAYIGTDSLIVDTPGLAQLWSDVDPAALGKLKLEASSDDVWIGGPNLYRFGPLERHKSIRDDATLVAPGVYEQQEWVSLRRALELGHQGGPLVRTIERALPTKYEGRDVLGDGRSRPLRLEGGRRCEQRDDPA